MNARRFIRDAKADRLPQLAQELVRLKVGDLGHLHTMRLGGEAGDA
jgi:hypothetical protein